MQPSSHRSLVRVFSNTVAARVLVAATALTFAACVPPAGDPVLDADARYIDVDGARGPFAVYRTEIASPSSADVFYPTEVDVARPLAVVVQGGLVAAERYHWLAVHLASKGFVTVVPQHVLDLAFFQQWKWARVLDEVKRLASDPESALAGLVDDAPGIALGHSLGGVVAAKAWLADEERVHTLVLLGGVPDTADDNSARSSGRVLSLTGSKDIRVTPLDAEEGASVYTAPTTVAAIEGMNHYQWTDAYTDGELETDGTPTVTDLTARARGLTLIDDALRELTGGEVRLLDDPSSWPIGVSTPE
jgi:pimeloyl-ACP methyl ester carboxylesterase